MERGRPQIAIWRTCVSCWIPKATNTHTEYVILIAFPLQQWLDERASMLRYTYTDCIVTFVCLYVYFLFCVLFLLLYITASFLFLYNSTDHSHRVETQLQSINIISCVHAQSSKNFLHSVKKKSVPVLESTRPPIQYILEYLPGAKSARD